MRLACLPPSTRAGCRATEVAWGRFRVAAVGPGGCGVCVLVCVAPSAGPGVPVGVGGVRCVVAARL